MDEVVNSGLAFDCEDGYPASRIVQGAILLRSQGALAGEVLEKKKMVSSVSEVSAES